MSAEAIVRIRHVHKFFTRGSEQIDVLNDLDLDVPEGEFLGLMGPSGSGKTTLLNLLGGLDLPSEGSITVAGDEITRMSGSKLTAWRARHVGFVFQMYNLIPVLTAFQNVELPLLLTHLSKTDRRRHVETALAVVGLDDRIHHYQPDAASLPGHHHRVGARQRHYGVSRTQRRGVDDRKRLAHRRGVGAHERRGGDQRSAVRPVPPE